MSDELTPITRKETFLAKAGGQNVVTPTPITREETFLQAIIDNGSGGGGGGGGGGVLVVTLDEDTHTLDKTWKEIHDAPYAVIQIIDSTYGHRFMSIYAVDYSEGQYAVVAASAEIDPPSITYNMEVFFTNSENGYPNQSV